jgi:hypothetical protein
LCSGLSGQARQQAVAKSGVLVSIDRHLTRQRRASDFDGALARHDFAGVVMTCFDAGFEFRNYFRECDQAPTVPLEMCGECMVVIVFGSWAAQRISSSIAF